VSRLNTGVADDQLVTDGVLVADDEPDLGSRREPEVVGGEPGMVDRQDDHRLGVRPRTRSDKGGSR
jgi:hypothetical protein